MIRKMISGVVGSGVALGFASTAFAQAALIKAPTAAQQLTMINKGDTAWLLVSSALVLMMSVPGLALFYGGLVRTKNMLSVLMQVFMIVSVAGMLWATVGYSMAFTTGFTPGLTPYVGGFSKALMRGIDATTAATTFSNNVYVPISCSR
jgi:Amt family ammonium transporter